MRGIVHTLWEDRDSGRPVLDVTATANRPGCLRAERRGKLALVLSRLDRKVKRADGKIVGYQVEDVELSEEENELACVRNNSYTYWSAQELAPFLKHGRSLFSFMTVL